MLNTLSVESTHLYDLYYVQLYHFSVGNACITYIVAQYHVHRRSRAAYML
jgi:hypothetical protein